MLVSVRYAEVHYGRFQQSKGAFSWRHYLCELLICFKFQAVEHLSLLAEMGNPQKEYCKAWTMASPCILVIARKLQ